MSDHSNWIIKAQAATKQNQKKKQTTKQQQKRILKLPQAIKKILLGIVEIKTKSPN